MGLLVDGKWVDRWYDTKSSGGRFVRSEAQFRKQLSPDPVAEHPAQAGRFKVPTLRNVAVTGPYMHNGAFEDLETVVRFYLKYTSLDMDRQVNPKTGERWRIPEVPKTLAVSELIKGEDLSERDIDALVAFMKTLTDARYEHLLEE